MCANKLVYLYQPFLSSNKNFNVKLQKLIFFSIIDLQNLKVSLSLSIVSLTLFYDFPLQIAFFFIALSSQRRHFMLIITWLTIQTSRALATLNQNTRDVLLDDSLFISSKTIAYISIESHIQFFLRNKYLFTVWKDTYFTERIAA